MIAAIIKDSEKKARDAETAARRHELTVRREQARKQREQERMTRGPNTNARKRRKHSRPDQFAERAAGIRLGELAKTTRRGGAIIRHHFTAFVGMQSWTASTDSWNVELWPDPVETQALLQKISAKIRKYIVLRPEALIATALWTMTAWHTRARRTPYSGRNFCRTRVRQEQPPWRSPFSSAETVCQRRTDWSQRIPYG